MTALVLKQQQSAKSDSSPAQKTFHRLSKKVEKLRASLERKREELDEALAFYHSHIAPQEKAWLHHLGDSLKLMYNNHYTRPKGLSRRDQGLLKELISDKILEIGGMLSTCKDLDPELQSIYKALNGHDYPQVVTNDLENLKSELEQAATAQGLDVDLSHLSALDDQNVTLKKLCEAMQQSYERSQETSPKPKKKSKRQEEKERKALELAELQQKGIALIYKQLAKAFHPDLEQDPALKAEKDELMKQITVAYEKRDLASLIALEKTWLHRADNPKGSAPHNDEQLKIYNSILKEQIDILETSLELALVDPKYLSIEKFLDAADSSPMLVLLRAFYEAQQMATAYRQTAIFLRGPQPVQTVRSALKTYFDER